MIAIDLRGRTAVVTGGGQGLGAATAQMLYEAGANIAINYFEDRDGNNRRRAEQVSTRLGERAVIMEADVREPPRVQSMIEDTIERFGGLDIVVNNAGIISDRTMAKMSQDQWQSVIDTNLTGVFNVCKATGDNINEGGRIVNMASIAAVVGFFGQSNYAAAKGGVVSLTRVLSRELARKNVTVNTVAPGVVLTEMGQSIPQKAREQMLAQVPLGRFAEPTEIAGAVLFLCSDLASYISGQTLHVNGGWWG